ncbi:unnamed protein product [Durusdinium trenchii]|uniref:Uncharacterized protein n=1 Tax=Durusdinium trenchii TaxID=1381693 RepID=A0ABP0KB97_9DINO
MKPEVFRLNQRNHLVLHSCRSVARCCAGERPKRPFAPRRKWQTSLCSAVAMRIRYGSLSKPVRSLRPLQPYHCLLWSQGKLKMLKFSFSVLRSSMCISLSMNPNDPSKSINTFWNQGEDAG